ncbi:MAG: SCP2 sterol-binding domain-containing protein [Polyangiales bacterium]
MTETESSKEARSSYTHIVFYITTTLRARELRAKTPDFMHRFPSEEWTEAYKNAINHCSAYREVGKAWTFGSVAMIIKCDLSLGLERDTGMVLDVHEGRCRGARFVEGTRDPEEAKFVIVASYNRWKDVIEGKLDPIKGMMEGKLKLTKGSLATLVRFVESSRRLVTNARNVPTEFRH